MVGSRCIIQGCKNVFRKDKHVSFHEFPSDRNASDKWMQLLEERGLVRPNFKMNSSTRICSDHFSDDCYVNAAKKIRLQRSAMPSIFSNEIPVDDLVEPRKRKNRVIKIYRVCTYT